MFVNRVNTKYLEMPCSNKVKTASGTFTAYNDVMSHCKAKSFCEKKSQILAPVTNQNDLDALVEMLDHSCPQHWGENNYHIGLDVNQCGVSEDRVFTNGVKYDKAIHGNLYDDYSEADVECPLAWMDCISPMPLMIDNKPNCYPEKMRVICLDQSTATASPVVQENSDSFEVTQSLSAIGGVCVVVGSIAFAAVMYKRNKDLKQKLYDLQK